MDCLILYCNLTGLGSLLCFLCEGAGHTEHKFMSLLKSRLKACQRVGLSITADRAIRSA